MKQRNLTDTEKIRAHLEERYPDNEYRFNRACKDFALRLWETFQHHDLRDNDFVEQFTSENIETHIQRYSEMLFAWHFINLGYVPTSQRKGPDLCIEHNGQRIWIEIITPSLKPPSGDSPEAQRMAKLVQDYQAPPPTKPENFRAIDVPCVPVLLRWTAALREKRNKWIKYLEKGLVQPNEPYLIAINSKLLGRHGFIGISQNPVPLEIAFAIGPMTITIDPKTVKEIDSGVSYRPHVMNHNQTDIPTRIFFDSSYKEVSGILATHVELDAATQPNPPSPLVLIHNPQATNPLPQGIWGAKEEYVAKRVEEHWRISDIHATG